MLQQSFITIVPSPHGTAPVMPAGTGNIDESKLYILGGRSNLISATSEEINPQPAPLPAEAGVPPMQPVGGGG